MDLAWHDRAGQRAIAGGETLRELDLEVLETTDADGAAEAQDGGFTDAGLPRDRGEGAADDTVGMLGHDRGDAALGGCELVEGGRKAVESVHKLRSNAKPKERQ